MINEWLVLAIAICIGIGFWMGYWTAKNLK